MWTTVPAEPTEVPSCLGRTGLYVDGVLAVMRRLEPRVTLDIEHVVPGADRRCGDGGHRDLWRRRAA